MKRSRANMILIVVTIVWGGGFIATNGALKELSPFYIMMIRFLGAAIIPLLLSWKKLNVMKRKEILHGIVVGILLFLAFAFQTFGLKYSTPSKNAFLTATNVAFVPYLLWFIIRRKPLKKEIIASLFCLFGIALLTLKPDALHLTQGDLLSLICAVFFALHIISLERYAARCDALCLTALQMITAGILSTICALLFEKVPTHFPVEAMGNLLYLIFVSTLLAYLLQTYAQKFTSANSAAIILSMEALFASIFSYFLLNETMTPFMVLGAALILVSLLYMELNVKKKKKS